MQPAGRDTAGRMITGLVLIKEGMKVLFSLSTYWRHTPTHVFCPIPSQKHQTDTLTHIHKLTHYTAFATQKHIHIHNPNTHYRFSTQHSHTSIHTHVHTNTHTHPLSHPSPETQHTL